MRPLILLFSPSVCPRAGTSASYRGHAEEPDDQYDQCSRFPPRGCRGPHREPFPEDRGAGRYVSTLLPSPCLRRGSVFRPRFSSSTLLQVDYSERMVSTLCVSGKHLSLGTVGTIFPIVSHLKHTSQNNSFYQTPFPARCGTSQSSQSWVLRALKI